jgi:hypothetical protein
MLDKYIYIRLKIKPNSIRNRCLSCQFFVLPSLYVGLKAASVLDLSRTTTGHQFCKEMYPRSRGRMSTSISLWSHLVLCLMSISRFSLRDKVTLRLLKLHFYGDEKHSFKTVLMVSCEIPFVPDNQKTFMFSTIRRETRSYHYYTLGFP